MGLVRHVSDHLRHLRENWRFPVKETLLGLIPYALVGGWMIYVMINDRIRRNS